MVNIICSVLETKSLKHLKAAIALTNYLQMTDADWCLFYKVHYFVSCSTWTLADKETGMTVGFKAVLVSIARRCMSSLTVTKQAWTKSSITSSNFHAKVRYLIHCWCLLLLKSVTNTVSPLSHHFVHCSIRSGREQTVSGPCEFKQQGGWETGDFAIYETCSFRLIPMKWDYIF